MAQAIENGWLTTAQHVGSPNCDERPADVDIDMIVVHGISLPPGQYGGDWVSALFTNSLDAQAHPYFAEIADLRVSAHLLIDRQGVITQYVSFDQRAWHAGQSCFDDRECCNDFAIGIELEGCDDEPYEQAQYLKLAEIILLLMKQYPAIMPHRVVGHVDIAPGRKTDPGESFDWSYLQRLVAAGDEGMMELSR